VPRASDKLPASYPILLEDIKSRIRSARIRAALSVNRELIELYWHIGRSIVKRQHAEGWGKSVVQRLSQDIRKEFTGISGFSAQNLWKMRGFYLAWTDDIQNLSQAVRDLDGINLPQAVREIPWGHNTELIFKLKAPVKRLWYARMALEHGWSRNVLIHQIGTDLYSRQGKAITNFSKTLPAPQSDLANQLLKDPYHLDFLAVGPDVTERQLEMALLERLKVFILELGKGFAFVGNQVHLEVGGKDYYLDLLFYHLHLRCYVVIDLKVEEFKPEFAGKMNFYLAAVDDLMRHPDDKPSIGLILCKEKNRIVVEYALRSSKHPVGVAEYKIMKRLPKKYQSELPTPKELRKQLRRDKKFTK
jgi:predicted nuclease of restriction endonuclease-like (RecB) superfamily